MALNPSGPHAGRLRFQARRPSDWRMASGFKIRLTVVAALAATLAASGPCIGAGSAPKARANTPVDPEGTLVAELVVQAREVGPPWWRVSRDGAAVYILGVPDGPTPPGVEWNQAVLDRRLTDANALIGAPRFTAGIFDLFAILRLRSAVKSKAPMETTLPKPLADRYLADAARDGKPPGRFSGWDPMVAGAFLLRETHAHWRPIDAQVRGVARRHGLSPQTSARYAAVPLAKTATKAMTAASQQACLAWALDDVEAGDAAARLAVEGWARGDVATALTAPRGFDKCLLVLTGGSELWNRASQDQADDIAAALDKPGHAVAVVGLRRLLAEGGVVARLEAKGLKVSGPGEP